MNKIYYVIVLCLLCLAFRLHAQQEAVDPNCKRWFKKVGLKQGPDCLVDCASSKVDMGTFMCTGLCAQMCRAELEKAVKKSPPIKSPSLDRAQRFWFYLSSLYPRLTDEERLLVAQYPLEMFWAYVTTWRVGFLCLDLFEHCRANDASDAFRHFVGSALLYKDLGYEMSEKILNAHEEKTDQPAEEKVMDLKNNHLGLSAAADLLKSKNLNQGAILQSFKTRRPCPQAN